MEGNILRNSLMDIPTCTSVNTRCVHSHSSDSLINVGNLVSAQENLPKEGNNPVSVNSDLTYIYISVDLCNQKTAYYCCFTYF